MNARVQLSKRFVKNYKSRVKPFPKLAQKVSQRIDLFLEERSHPLIRDHKLVGKKESFYAFSITGDMRIIYIELASGVFLFDDIGSHNQVYE